MLSFVIPTLNEAENLPGVLRFLQEAFPDSETIVVDGGSGDRTTAEALALADVVLLGEAGRARQMNLGAAAARCEWIVFLHADTRPRFSWQEFEPVLARGRPWGFCRVDLQGRPRALRLISWAMNLRARLSSVATGDQMLFVRRDFFQKAGAYADIPLMEDVELCKRLRRLHRPEATTLRVSSSGRRWEQYGVVPTVLRMWALRLAYCLGVPPSRLWDHYYGQATPATDAAVSR